jgi:hypothetical protein
LAGVEVSDPRLDKYKQLVEYWQSRQRRQLKVKIGAADDNLTLNFTNLIVARTVSMLFGGGVTWDIKGAEQKSYIEQVFDVNKQELLLHKLGQIGAVYGTCFVKIIPDVLKDPITGDIIPRLVALNPAWMEIEVRADDLETVEAYHIRYTLNEVAFHEETRRDAGGTWTVKTERADRTTGGRYETVNVVQWPHDFPPILHWQNLPNMLSPYGEADIEHVVELQDRINFVGSNISKIIRHHAHPKTWGRGFNPGQLSQTSWAADEMITLPTDTGEIQNLEMQSDLESSEKFLEFLRQAMFDVTRTVDLTSMADRIGSLTNFGLRVLYSDALNKNSTKREMYGDALLELNRRLLVLKGYEGEQSDPGEIHWGEAIPQDARETIEALMRDLQMGIVSKQTAARIRGYDWEKEQELLQAEQAQGDSVGAAILRAFSVDAAPQSMAAQMEGQENPLANPRLGAGRFGIRNEQ